MRTDLISLKDASAYCDYSPDYLNLLVRKGLLKALKIGRNWLTTKEWLSEYLRRVERHGVAYISLKDASAYCDYSPDYLNLLVRKGLLKALKIGRNWLTTKEWLSEYLRRIEQKQAKQSDAEKASAVSAARLLSKVAGRESNFEVAGVADEKTKADVEKVFVANGGTAVGEMENHDSQKTAILKKITLPEIEKVRDSRHARLNFAREFAVAAIAVSVCGVLIVGIQNRNLMVKEPAIIAQAGLWQAGQSIASMAGNFSQAIYAAVDYWGSKLSGGVDYALHGKTEIVAVETKVPAEAVDKIVLQLSADALERDIINDTKGRMNDFRNVFDLPIDESGEKSAAEPEGIVVVPLSGDEQTDRETEEKIRNNFSDEIVVKPTSDVSGVIVPEFKDKSGQPYMYMMVPVKGTN